MQTPHNSSTQTVLWFDASQYKYDSMWKIVCIACTVGLYVEDRVYSMYSIGLFDKKPKKRLTRCASIQSHQQTNNTVLY